MIIKHRYKGGVHATHNNTVSSGVSICTGHLHSLKVTPYSDYNGVRYGVDTGTLAETDGPQFTYAHQAGFWVEWKDKFTIGRGTKIATGNTRCIVLDYDKMQSKIETTPKLVVHTSKPVQSNDTAVNN